MKKFTKSAFSLILSLSLVFGLFSCIPVSAATLAESNINFLDENITNDVTVGTVTYEKKIAKLNTASAYAGTTLRMTAIPQNYIPATYDTSKNLITSIDRVLSNGTTDTLVGTDSTRYNDGLIYDAKGTTTSAKADSFLTGSNFLTTDNIYKGDKLGVDRIEEGGYDFRLIFDLSKPTTLDTFYLFGGYTRTAAIITYKVHISNSKADLFTDDSYVLYWDYYEGFKVAANSYLWNGINSTADGKQKRSEGQIWNFTGDEKPFGRYIGVEIVDAAYNKDDAAITTFNLYEAGAYGTQQDYLVFADKDVTNDIAEDQTEALDTKLALLEAESKVLGTKLRMTALDKDYVSNLTANSPNLIQSAKIKNYTDEAFSDVNSTALGNITDGAFPYGTGSALSISGKNTYIGSSGKTGLFYDGSDETIGDVHGADRVTADVYDALITLDLGKSTEIHDFYMFNHVNINTSIATYKVYVSDSEENLYAAENEVLYWNYYNGFYDTETAAKRSVAYLFNGIGTGYTELRRSEGQHWKFTQTKPKGRYVGVKIYEASTISNNDFLTIYEIGVLSAETYKLNFNHGEAVKVKIDEPYVTVGETANFEILKSDEVNVTSVTANGNDITATNGVYTIENITADLEINITTDSDSRFPDAEGIYNGIDLTKNSSFYGTSLWEGDTVYAETVTLYEGRNEISLAYPIDNVISVRSYDLQSNYTYGIDYTVNDGKLVITADTSIPVCDNSEYDITNILQPGTSRLDYDAITYWKNQQYKYQIAVTYTHSKSWGNNSLYEVKPEGKLSKLSNLYEKLKNGEEVDVVFYGDSTTLGWNASGLDEMSLAYNGGKDASSLNSTHATMHGVFGLSSVPDWACDTWAHQVVNNLAKEFGTKVNIINKAVGSSDSAWGSATQNMDFLLDGLEPDLMVIAYGGNDREYSSETMNTNITTIIDYVRAKTPDCDVVVPSTFKRGYPETGTGNLANHEVGYYQLEENIDNLVVVPVHSYTESLMTTVKEHFDYTANGYNHMNDFGQRLYASVISGYLSEKEYTISFADGLGKIFYTTTVSERNPVLTSDQISAAEVATPIIFGYNSVGWDKDLETQFVGDTIVSALYSRDTTTYNIGFTDTSGKIINQDVEFDQRFTLKDAEAGSFLVDGQIIGGAKSVTLYGCGEISITASKDAAPSEPSIAILKTLTNEKVNGKNLFRVFVHLYNPAKNEIAELGVMFAPGSVYSNDESFTQETLNSNDFITLSSNVQTTDLLATFGGIKTNTTRVVRAYATIGNSNIYSGRVYSHTFN